MSSPPEWLATLADTAAAEMAAAEAISPIGCHYYFNDATGQWEVTLFASRTEVVGGENDGSVWHTPFSVDLLGLMTIFDEVTNCYWQALPLGEGDDLGPHVAIEGRYADCSVWLRILATSPARFESGRYADMLALRLHDAW